MQHVIEFPECFYKLIDNQAIKFTFLSPHPTAKNYAFYIYQDTKSACLHNTKINGTYKTYDDAIDAEILHLESQIDLLKSFKKGGE